MFDETSPLVGLHSVSEGDYNTRYRVCALMQIRRLPQTERRQVRQSTLVYILLWIYCPIENAARTCPIQLIGNNKKLRFHQRLSPNSH